ncbi:MAG: glycosyltransferase family A protein [Microthrixaceae bacterium]
MRVSVIIPCFNSLEYLPLTLRSVFDQDFTDDLVDDYEIILVDDGGSDDLAGWLADQPYPDTGGRRVRVLRQPNGGVSAARNFGVRESSGDLIAFCDSDDLWTPSTAGHLTRCFVDDPSVGLAYGWYDVIDAGGEPSGRVHRSTSQGRVWKEFVLDNPVSASGVMVSRRAIEASGGFSENRDRFPIDVEDWELWIRLAREWPVALVSEVITHHRRHESNSSTDIESLELAYCHLMDVVFADADAEQSALRPQAQARYKMILAWQSLNDRNDPASAKSYLADAVADVPSLRRSPGYWRLRLSTMLLGATGDRGYEAVRGLNNVARRAKERVKSIRPSID